MIAAILLGAGLVAGCTSAAEPEVYSADCAGAPWQDISAGLVPCEHLSKDRCAFSDEQKPVPVDSTNVHWVCTCGSEIHLYWCKSVG